MNIEVVDVLMNHREQLHYQLTLSNGSIIGIHEEDKGTLVVDNYSQSFDLFLGRMTPHSLHIVTKQKEQA